MEAREYYEIHMRYATTPGSRTRGWDSLTDEERAGWSAIARCARASGPLPQALQLLRGLDEAIRTTIPPEQQDRYRDFIRRIGAHIERESQPMELIHGETLATTPTPDCEYVITWRELPDMPVGTPPMPISRPPGPGWWLDDAQLFGSMLFLIWARSTEHQPAPIVTSTPDDRAQPSHQPVDPHQTVREGRRVATDAELKELHVSFYEGQRISLASVLKEFWATQSTLQRVGGALGLATALAPTGVIYDTARAAIFDLARSIGASPLPEIRAERVRQDREWGGLEHDRSHSPSDWIALITQHAGRALGRDFRRQMIQIAALAVAAVETYDRLHAPMSTSA